MLYTLFPNARDEHLEGVGVDFFARLPRVGLNQTRENLGDLGRVRLLTRVKDPVEKVVACIWLPSLRHEHSPLELRGVRLCKHGFPDRQGSPFEKVE